MKVKKRRKKKPKLELRSKNRVTTALPNKFMLLRELEECINDTISDMHFKDTRERIITILQVIIILFANYCHRVGLKKIMTTNLAEYHIFTVYHLLGEPQQQDLCELNDSVERKSKIFNRWKRMVSSR